MYKILSNGVKMPQFGLGTFLVADGKKAYDTTLEALKMGYRHIDTAQAYKNEASIGDAIKDSNIKREDLFITTKQILHADESIMQKAFDDSLKKLKLDYIDLYLIHWPHHDEAINTKTWAFLETLYASKKVRAIGVSNFKIHHLEALLKHATIIPMVNQVECHVGLQQQPLRLYHQSKGIITESYGPLMKGGIFEAPFVETLKALAKSYDASVAQMAIAWGLHNDIVMIPKSETIVRIKENLDATNIHLSQEDLEALNKLNRGKRVYTDPDNHPWGYTYETTS